MKTVAYFSDYILEQKEEEQRIQYIKQVTDAGQVIGVMSHLYLQNGMLANESSEKRAEKGIKAGADLIMQMSAFSSLSSIGIYAFAAARILDKLGTVNEVVLEVEDATWEQLQKITYLLIANTRQFQQRVTHFKKLGMIFQDAQAKAIGEIIPGGEEIMRSTYNVFAVECIKSLKIMYSSIKCVCVPKMSTSMPAVKDHSALSMLLKDKLLGMGEEFSDYYGGYEELTKRILKNVNAYQDFVQFSEVVAGTDKDIYDVRKFFLRVVSGITKSTIGVWRLYDFSPYCKVYTQDKALYRHVKEKSDIFLFATTEEVLEMEHFKQELWNREVQMESKIE